jgi:hypothetical protein
MLLTLALGLLPAQPLAAGQCALVLWDLGTRERIAMAGTDALALVLDGRPLRLARQDEGEDETVYAAGGVVARTRLVVEMAPDGRNGMVKDGVLSVRAGEGEELVVPVYGLFGCG